jgi:hypothetical protein
MLKVAITQELSKRDINKLGEFADDIIKSSISDKVNAVIERNIPVYKTQLQTNGLVAFGVDILIFERLEIAELYSNLSAIVQDNDTTSDKKQAAINAIFKGIAI